MKKLILLWLCLSQSLSLLAQDWLQQLVNLNTDIIDSVVYLPDFTGCEAFRSYMIHYHQPLQHDEPELGNLPLRAVLSVRQQDDCTQQMMQTWIGGYALDSASVVYADTVAVLMQRQQHGELFGRYGGNLLLPEHRYFGESCPESPWTTIGYCEAKEAAADFHALFEAVKKIFTGKWVITGGSKGGITTTIQHAYYPDDADCYVAYAAPFQGYNRDTRMQDYWMEHGLTPELNKKILDIQREMLQRPSLFDLYCQLYPDPDPAEIIKASLLYQVASFEFDKRAYWSRQRLEDAFAYNESVIAAYCDNRYTDEMLLYFMQTNKMLLDDDYTDWYNENIAPLLGSATRGVFGIDEEVWKDEPNISYFYQAIHELGYFDLKWDYYFTEQKDIDEATQTWQNLHNNAAELASNGVFNEVVYNPDLFDFVCQQTAQAQKPILFIYGGDDAWTGARMEDEYINGDNVQLYILPAQNHGVCITDVTDEELQAKLWAFTDAVFSSPTGISQLDHDHVSSVRTYDLLGNEVGDEYHGLVIKNGKKLILNK